jgi:hypothetical protein
MAWRFYVNRPRVDAIILNLQHRLLDAGLADRLRKMARLLLRS